jgi:hypothetical protein
MVLRFLDYNYIIILRLVLMSSFVFNERSHYVPGSISTFERLHSFNGTPHSPINSESIPGEIRSLSVSILHMKEFGTTIAVKRTEIGIPTLTNFEFILFVHR